MNKPAQLCRGVTPNGEQRPALREGYPVGNLRRPPAPTLATRPAAPAPLQRPGFSAALRARAASRAAKGRSRRRGNFSPQLRRRPQNQCGKNPEPWIISQTQKPEPSALPPRRPVGRGSPWQCRRPCPSPYALDALPRQPRRFVALVTIGRCGRSAVLTPQVAQLLQPVHGFGHKLQFPCARRHNFGGRSSSSAECVRAPHCKMTECTDGIGHVMVLVK